MRLLYLTRSLGLHDRRLIDGLVRFDVELSVVCMDSLPAAGPPPTPDGVRTVEHLGLETRAIRELDAATGRLREIVSRTAPTLILAGPVTDGSYLAVRCKSSVPVVVQSWASDVFWEALHEPAAAARARVALRGCDGLFADCHAVVERCEELAGRRIPAHHLMPWGINLTHSETAFDHGAPIERLGLNGRKIFLCTRALEPIYGVVTLLDAFARVHRSHPNVALIWAGDGSERPLAEKFIVDHGLQDAVRLLGNIDPTCISAYFNTADVYVSCSLCDGTSVSLLEAMSYGLPVIVSRIGGNAEWVKEAENGWLCECGDAGEFAQAMYAAANLPPTLRNSMAVANRAQVADRANLNSNFIGFVDFLKQIAMKEGVCLS
jgi:glycosyltransferase involved in cell wall biosynthesis